MVFRHMSPYPWCLPKGEEGREASNLSCPWCFMLLEYVLKRLPHSVIVGNGEETNSVDTGNVHVPNCSSIRH